MYAGYHLQQSEQVVAIAFQAAEEIGLNPKAIKSGGGSDANIFNSYGIPTVNLAVGYENIHTKKERISIQQLINLTNLVLRSEEHTSELQSRGHLVCRLLLEKKNNMYIITPA